MPRALAHRSAQTGIRYAAIAIVAASAGVFAVATPAVAVATPCDTTVLDWSQLKSAMLSGDDVVCLGASISNVGDHLTAGGAPKTLDLNGFDLLIVADNKHSAIDVPAAMSLTLQATGGGTFRGRGGEDGAGLGGAGNSGLRLPGHAGSITILNGTWTLAGGLSAAGIGGGWGGAGGPVIIAGGTVTATSGSYGAGIGGGDGGAGADVDISGGVVSIDAGYLGAGIGGGVYGAGADVTISGGRLAVNGGCQAPAIGSGAGGAGAGTLTVIGLGASSPSGPGTDQVCSALSVGLSPTTARVDGAAGVSFVMTGDAETATSDARTELGYSYDVTTSVGGVLAEVSVSPVAYGEMLESLPDPTTRAGMVFDSWRLTSPTGEAFDFSTPITAPTTLYAGWADSPELAATGADADRSLATAATALLAVGLGALLLTTRRAARR